MRTPTSLINDAADLSSAAETHLDTVRQLTRQWAHLATALSAGLSPEQLAHAAEVAETLEDLLQCMLDEADELARMARDLPAEPDDDRAPWDY